MISSLLEHTISASMDNAGCESDSVHVRSEDNGTSQCNEIDVLLFNQWQDR
jgi:hypothetical protein